VSQVPGVLNDPIPQVFLSGLGTSSVDWQLRVWSKTEDYWNVYQAAIRELKYALDQAGIGIPFPQLYVHFDSSTGKTILSATRRKPEAHA